MTTKEEKKDVSMWITSSSGKKSASLTFATIGFIIVALWLLVSIVEHIGPFKVRAFNAGEAMIFLGPLLANYFGRRWTEDVSGKKTTKPSND